MGVDDCGADIVVYQRPAYRSQVWVVVQRRRDLEGVDGHHGDVRELCEEFGDDA